MERERERNLVVISLFIVIAAFTAFHEGYVSLISFPFLLTLLAGCSLTIWLAWNISTRRLLSLIFVILVLEYIKETIGIRSGMWTYHGIDGGYNFGIWAWVLGGLVTYTLSTRLIIRLMRKLRLSSLRWLNPCVLVLLFLFILLSLGKYGEGAGILFYSFYAVVLVVCLYASIKTDLSDFAAIVLTSWIVGNPSEFMGSVASGVWTFTFNPNYPPIFLLFGCWPLDIFAIYSISAFLSGEPLDKDTY
jgi:hypothetical protein